VLSGKNPQKFVLSILTGINRKTPVLNFSLSLYLKGRTPVSNFGLRLNMKIKSQKIEANFFYSAAISSFAIPTHPSAPHSLKIFIAFAKFSLAKEKT
jgi:hypothetical protein